MCVPSDVTEAFHELCAYTLSLGDPWFVHQHVVDAFAAQQASPEDKPIKTALALIGLLLAVERGYSGRRVQHAHVRLARRRRQWPRFDLPHARGAMTVFDVLRAISGPARDEAIPAWSASVWEAWRDSHAQVRHLLREMGQDPSGGQGPPTESRRKARDSR